MIRIPFAILGCLLLLTACGRKDGVQVGEKNIIGTEVFRMGMPIGGKIVDPVHGKESWFAYGAMSGVEGTPANGVAMAHFFDDETFIYTIQLNIAPAPDGYFYEGWLVNGSEVMSTEHLGNYFGDSQHQLRFETDQDLRDFLTVIVTLEPDDGDPAPAKHVAEGVMKVTKRP